MTNNDMELPQAPFWVGRDAKKMKKKDFERELARLEVELVTLQGWIKETGAKVAVVFEGRDAAGKGGVIKRLTNRTSPRVVKVVALPAPTEKERTQWYFQRYVAQLPAAGEMILFDRSWYNRAGVERVMGFCDDDEYEQGNRRGNTHNDAHPHWSSPIHTLASSSSVSPRGVAPTATRPGPPTVTLCMEPFASSAATQDRAAFDSAQTARIAGSRTLRCGSVSFGRRRCERS